MSGNTNNIVMKYGGNIMVKKYRLLLLTLCIMAYCYFVYYLVYSITYNDLKENKLYDESALKGGVTLGDELSKEEAAEVLVVNAGTIYILEKYEIRTGEYTNEILPVPIELMGLDEDKVYNYYLNYSNKLNNSKNKEYSYLAELSEQNIVTNIKNIELVSFDNNILVARMNYEYIEPEYKYVAFREKEKIVVYKTEDNTIYANADVRWDELPYGLKVEIENGKYFVNETQLYYFLESYTS